MAYLQDLDLCASMSSLPISREDFADLSLACLGVGGDKRHHFVGSAEQDFVGVGGEQNFVVSARQDFVGVGGEADKRQNLVGSGVSGNGGRSSASRSQSGELVAGRFGGLMSRFSHVNMHRLLIEDKRCMLSGIPPKMVGTKKKVSFAFRANPVAEAQAARYVETHNLRSDKHQDNNIYDDDDDADEVIDVWFDDGFM